MSTALAAPQPVCTPDSTHDDAILESPVRDFMTPGCLTISELASVAEAARALEQGLLGWLGRDRSRARARDAITEQVTAIDPDGRVRVALYALSTAGTTRLLVRTRAQQLPEGVLTDFDLAAAAGR